MRHNVVSLVSETLRQDYHSVGTQPLSNAGRLKDLETIAELEVLREEKELQEKQEHGQSGTDEAK
jgi:hypothetical protein